MRQRRFLTKASHTRNGVRTISRRHSVRTLLGKSARKLLSCRLIVHSPQNSGLHINPELAGTPYALVYDFCDSVEDVCQVSALYV